MSINVDYGDEPAGKGARLEMVNVHDVTFVNVQKHPEALNPYVCLNFDIAGCVVNVFLSESLATKLAKGLAEQETSDEPQEAPGTTPG